MSNHPLNYLAPAGRLLLATIFVASGANMITDWETPAQMMADKGLPAVPVLLSVAVALEIIGGLSVLVGAYARLGALLLLAFLVPVSLVMHDFWTMEGAERMTQMINFMKNVSIAGGVVLVLAFGAGPLSVDRLLRPRPKELPQPAVHA